MSAIDPTAAAAPQYSPDGRYWWNGASWTLVPVALKKKSHKVLFGILGGIGALVVLTMGLGAIGAAVGGGSSSSSNSPAKSPVAVAPVAIAPVAKPSLGASPTPSPSAKPTPSPIRTTPSTTGPSQHALAQNYIAVVSKDAPVMSGDLTTLSQCGQDFTCWDTSAYILQLDTQTFQSDLPTAPACLKTTDTELRAGLTLILAASKDIQSAIATVDSSLLTQASDEMTQGNSHINAATAAINSANCS